MSEDLLSTNPLPGGDKRKYYERFGYIAENSFASFISQNKGQTTILTDYLDGVLNLKGFYFSDNWGKYSELNTLFLETGATDAVLGFSCVGNRHLTRFDADSLGTHVFVAFRCSNYRNFMAYEQEALAYSLFALPYPTDGLQQEYSKVQDWLICAVFKEDKYRMMRLDMAAKMYIRDEIYGNVQETSINEILKVLEGDEAMVFLRELPK